MDKQWRKDQFNTLREKLPANEADYTMNDHIVATIPIVWKLAGKYARKFKLQDNDELISEGYAGLCHAAKKYNPEKGAKFATYAYMWVKAFIIDYLRREMRYDDDISLDVLLENDEGENSNKESLLNVAVVDSSTVKAQKIHSEKAFEKITEKDIQMVRDFYGLNGKPLSYTAIAKKYNLYNWKIAREMVENTVERIKANCDKFKLSSDVFFI